MKYLDSNGLLYLIQKIKTWLTGKVDKVDGKGLSTNDYTTDEKTKLSGIATGANKTTINNTLTSTSTTEALSANQGKILNDKISAINTNLEDLGAGDMLKSVYDTDGDGIVDNAEKLGGQLPSYYAKASDIPTNNNQLTNGAGYITGITKNNVTTALGFTPYNSTNPNGYQTSSQVTTAINNAISNIQGISYEVVTSLPSTGSAGVIYLISNGGSNPNIYDEYIYANSKFEKIGTTDVDLSGYLQESDFTAITNSEIDNVCSLVE